MTRSAMRAGLTVLVGALLISGCAVTYDATELGVPTAMAASARDSVQGTAFSVTKHPVYMFWGLARVASPNLEDVLAGQTGTGARIVNLRIKARSRWTDLLVTAITFGFASPRSVTFEGVVVPAAAPTP